MGTEFKGIPSSNICVCNKLHENLGEVREDSECLEFPLFSGETRQRKPAGVAALSGFSGLVSRVYPGLLPASPAEMFEARRSEFQRDRRVFLRRKPTETSNKIGKQEE